MSLLEMIAAERRRVADFATDLDTDELRAQSLCAEWTVHDVLAHLLMPLVTSTPAFVVAMARSRFDFDRANLALTAKVSRRTRDEIVAGLRERADHPFKPPGFTHEAPLTDLLIHTQDMARPLGRQVEPPIDAVVLALDFATGAKAARSFGVPSAVDDLRLRATDTAWSRGEGAEVTGRALDLLLALTSRREALARLEGDGLPALSGS